MARLLRNATKTYNMKNKIFLLALLFAVTTNAKAQYLKLGINFANITTTNDGDIDNSKILTGFQIGFTGDAKLGGPLYLQSGILFNSKGAKTQSGNANSGNYYKASSNPMYLEVPLNLVFKTPTKNAKLFFGAGPYIAMGIAGKNKVEGRFGGIAFSSNENIKWADDDPSTLNYEEGSGYGIVRRFDYGFNALAGIETKDFQLGINYGLGLAKLQSGSNSSADDKNKHRVFSITMAFKL